MVKGLSFFILIIILSACSYTKNPTQKASFSETTERPNLVKGNIISAGIFSYYLPSNYSDTVKFPIFFIFDPHGNGNSPLNKYSSWAEKYGFILTASNMSKNGLPQNQIDNIIKQFFKKIIAEFSIDSNRIYVMGFSGGARVASIAAMENPQVRGMVLCGGGLAYRGLPQGKKMDVLSFAGKEDFNLLELMNLDTLLDGNFRHLLLRFNGHHQWPDSLTMENAFVWTLFNEMKDGILPVKNLLVKNFILKNKKLIKTENDIFSKYLLLKKIIVFADGLADIKIFHSQLKQIEQTQDYKNYLKKFNKIIADEQKQEQVLVQDITSQSFDWWHTEIKKLSADSSKNSLQSVSHKRILNYLSLAAYMQCNGALKSNRNDYAEHFIGLYQLIDPDNSEGYYMEAQLAVRKNDLSAAIIALQKAINLGFCDFERINNETDFVPLFNMPEFKMILDKIRK